MRLFDPWKGLESVNSGGVIAAEVTRSRLLTSRYVLLSCRFCRRLIVHLKLSVPDGNIVPFLTKSHKCSTISKKNSIKWCSCSIKVVQINNSCTEVCVCKTNLWNVTANRRQPIRGDPMVCGVGNGLTILRRKTQLITKCYTGIWNWKWSFGFHKRRECSWLADSHLVP